MANYLYNGEELPALPEWDKTAYPYVVIYKEVGGWYALEMFTEQPIAYSDGENYLVCGVPGGCGALYWGTVSSTDREWGDNAYATYDSYDGREIQFLDGTKYLYSLFWSNSDILKEDGTLYLAASDPIPILAPVIDPLSMWMGWKAGNWVARQRGKAKQPVAFLYNGVRLPKLPEWDREMYPYAVIKHHMTGERLLCAKNPIVEVLADNGESTGIVYVAGDCIYATCKTNSNSWGDFNADSDVSLTVNPPFWTNTDIYLNDGTLYLAASEPVPVYE